MAQLSLHDFGEELLSPMAEVKGWKFTEGEAKDLLQNIGNYGPTVLRETGEWFKDNFRTKPTLQQIKAKARDIRFSKDPQAVKASASKDDLDDRIMDTRREIMGRFNQGNLYSSQAREQGWEGELDNAARAKADIMAQGAHDARKVYRTISYSWHALPIEKNANGDVHVYISGIYDQGKGVNPSVTFSQAELRHLSSGQWVEAQQPVFAESF